MDSIDGDGSNADDGGMTTNDLPGQFQTGPTTRRSHHAGHIVAIVVGCLMVLPALGLMLGGAAAAAAQAFATDDGYFDFAPDRVSSDGVAVAATDLWLDGADQDDDAPAWLLGLVDVDLRLRVEPADASTELFVGIARTADAERYLDGIRFSDVVEMDGREPVYRQRPGSSSVAAPDSQDFWNVSADGTGEQEVEWHAQNGRWSVVVMNADGSSDVAADVEIGFRSGAVVPIAIVMIVTGVLGLAGGVVLIIVGGRGRRTPETPRPTSGDPSAPVNSGPTGDPLTPPVPGSAVHDYDRPADAAEESDRRIETGVT